MNQAYSTVESDRVLVWDGWRGVAILLVLCDHFFDISWMWEGRMGVDVFFVLSGMLMSSILFEKRLSLKDFYIRRFSRVYPAYVVFVILMFMVALVFSVDFKWSELVANLLFLRTYLPLEPGIWDSGAATGHLWSLNVEEHSYFLLSALSLFFINRKIIGVVLLLLALVIALHSLYRFTQLSEEQFRLFMIRTESAAVFVMFSAGYGLIVRRYSIVAPVYVPAACFALAAVCYFNVVPLWALVIFSPVLLGVAVNHLHTAPTLMQSVLCNPVIRKFGLWSFSIYLWQQFFYMYAWRVPGGKPVALALAIVAGVASFYILEQPLRRWMNNRWSAVPTYRAQVV